MTEAIGFSSTTSGIEALFFDPEHQEVAPESQKTADVACALFDSIGEAVETEREMGSVVLSTECMLCPDTEALETEESLSLAPNEIESTEVIDPKGVGTTTGRLYFLAACILFCSDEALIESACDQLEACAVEEKAEAEETESTFAA